MSLSLTETIKAVQSRLKQTVDGRPLIVDGAAGVDTWGAIYKAIVGDDAPAGMPVPAAGHKADSRSERAIATLHPRVQPYARALVERAAQRGIIIKVLSGNRTYAEQNALFAQGRTTPGDRVTNARGGFSNHNFGIAFDVGVFTGSADPEKATGYVKESPAYKAVAAIGMDLGLDWGGNWKTDVDEPHFQLRPGWAKGMTEGAMLTELRARVAAGKDLFA